MTTLERLIKIGYDEKQAYKLYNLYRSNGDLDGLEDFIISNEYTETCR